MLDNIYKKIKLKLSLRFRKTLKSDNKNKSLKLNRARGSFIVLIPLAIIINYIIISIISFFVNVAFFIFTAIKMRLVTSIIENIKNHNYFLDISINRAIDNLFNSGSIGVFFVYIIGGIFFLLTAKKMYDLRVNYSDKVLKKGYEATNRWTRVDELFSQYQKVDLRPSIRIKVPVGSDELLKLEEDKEFAKTLEVKDGLDISRRYKKYLKSDTNNEFKFEGYIFKNDKPVYKVLKKINWFDGVPGNVISRWKDIIFVDDSFAHTFGNGTTSSGKTQMFVYPLIDICSRIKDINKRCSFILFDPKLELYKSSKRTLEERGYIVRLINIDNPKLSAGYNPLTVVVTLYKEGKIDEAEQMAKTYAYSVFNSNQDDNLEVIWKKTATQLFTALIIAQVSDCINLDIQINEKRKTLFEKRQNAFLSLTDEEKEKAIIDYDEAIKLGDDVLDRKDIIYIPSYAEFIETKENEKNVNIYSVIHFFRDLVDRASLKAGKEVQEADKKAQSLLDDYFNSRDSKDYARSLYEISKSSAGKTKGSIYLNMQTELDMFALENIANLTAENDIEIEDISYGNKPYAIFLGIPAEDKSNHFLATTFLSQTSQRLYRLALSRGGELPRKVHFCFDEVGNMPQVYMLQQQVTINRAPGMYYHLWVQAKEQMEDVYGKYANNIIENCGNQIYIMSTGTETSKYFSELLGNTEVVTMDRMGDIHSLKRSFTERVDERPLMYDYELRNLRKGECVIARPMKRTDIRGVDVKPYPILNEIADKIGVISYLKCIYRCFIKRRYKGAGRDIQNNKTSFLTELKSFIADEKRYKGTALYYSYTYMSREFPNSKEIQLEDICNESRAHIDFRSRINDPAKTVEKLKELIEEENKNKDRQRKLKDLDKIDIFIEKMSLKLGNDFFDKLNIDLDSKIEDVITIIQKGLNQHSIKEDENLDASFKKSIIRLLNS